MLKRLLVCLLLTALLTGSAAGAYLPAAEAASPDVYSAGERITGVGVDVSQFQGDIDWGTAARSIDFAIIRCYARGQADQNGASMPPRVSGSAFPTARTSTRCQNRRAGQK